jgi:leucyl/phenylalanyl-tRNA--protein transferase
MRSVRKKPLFLQSGSHEPFPDPGTFDRDGLVAFGGDLSVERLLAAYSAGIFPWYEEGLVPMWWSPDPRGIVDRDRLHVSRSLRRRVRRGGFTLTWNRCFPRVMTECGRQRREGTWVIAEMVDAYTRLHRCGHAHSLEVWSDGELVGGTYGVQVGALFAAESMFHRRTDMSKVALVALVQSLFAAGIELLDVQFVTPHLAAFGAFAVPRREYLQRVARATAKTVDLRGLVPSVSSSPTA